MSTEPLNWMTNLPAEVRKRPLTEIKIPGSHDSGAFVLSKEWHAYPSRGWSLGNVAVRLPWIRGILADWTLTHSNDLYRQMRQGIRYFDLRVSFDKNDFWLTHSFYTTRLLPQLRAVKLFLNEHPKEIAILQIKAGFLTRGTMTPEVVSNLAALLKNEFQDLWCKPPLTVSLDALTEKNQRVLICFDGQQDFWDSSLFDMPWDNTDNLDARMAAIQKRLSALPKNPNLFQGVLWTLTPQTETVKSDIWKRLFKPCGSHDSVAQMAERINGELSKMNKSDFANVSIVAFDFPDDAAIRTIINANLN